MPTEIKLYSGIYSWNVEDIMNQIDASKGDITMRINSPGGSVFDGYGILAKLNEAKSKGKKINMKVDGLAASFAAFTLLYADNVEALDVTKIMFHRADMYTPTEEDKKFLNGINEDLKSKMLMKFSNDKFKRITGTSIDEMFNPDKRVNVWISAEQAKDLGLISDYKKLDPTQELETVELMNSHLLEMGFSPINKPKENPSSNANEGSTQTNQNKKTMTLDELKQNHPAVFAAAVQLGRDQEFDRVNACLAFAHVDLDGVKKAVASKENLTQTQMAEFAMKMFSADALAALSKTNEKPVDPAETKVQANAQATQISEEQKKVDDFLAEAAAVAKKRIGLEK